MALVNTAGYAEAPELRTVMPNSWRKVTRLVQEEERLFLQRNQNLMERIIKEAREPFERGFNLGADITGTLSMTRIYREQVGEDIFYRILMINSQDPDFTDQWEIAFLQTLVYEHDGNNLLLAMGTYNSPDGARTRCVSLDIIQSGNRGKGILITELRYGRDTYDLLKGQIEGILDARYVYINNIVTLLNSTNDVPPMSGLDIYVYKGLPYISISASSCLVDPDIPLRYSLQNAFDGDPTTSYVENTEDDLMEISLSGSYLLFGSVRRTAIINGYAQNLVLYKNNNRVQTVRIFDNRGRILYKTQLLDNMLGWQFLEGNTGIAAASIYRGDRYNNTCIAELNIYMDNRGWLFGEIDE
jgi:hypothetical protein